MLIHTYLFQYMQIHMSLKQSRLARCSLPTPAQIHWHLSTAANMPRYPFHIPPAFSSDISK
jgi:hypothetical protein